MNVEMLSLPAALAAGLAGGAHCAAMCGGIATAAGASFRAGEGLALGPSLAFNGARLAGYATIGAGLAGLFGSLGAALPIERIALAGRLAAVAVMAALAIRLLTGRDVLGLERLGGWAWKRLRPLFGRAMALPGASRHAAMGFLWGWLPCGLVYSVLLVAAAPAEPLAAAATMLAFGLGTLPPLLGLTLGAASLGTWLRRPPVRRLAGALVLTCAAWTLAPMLLPHDAAHAHTHAT
ncbi:MAG: sulfite exporter TauE/SafE family protein, partial [Pseudomonadota bacterium]